MLKMASLPQINTQYILAFFKEKTQLIFIIIWIQILREP